jgi:probable rRNA maturation factor
VADREAGPEPTEGHERRRSIYRDDHRIDLVVRAGVEVPVPLAAIGRAAADALTAAGAPGGSSLAVILSNDAELAALNVEHMGHEGPTDVLSFPLLPPSAFPGHEGGAGPGEAPGVAFALPPGRRTHLGDVVVSVERAMDQAETGRGGQTGDVRWSVGEELRLLVVHGALHVCGWDHAGPAEERAMRSLERQVLAGGG